MARRPRVLAPQVLYHVIVRGNHRQVTFRTPADYQAYLEQLGRYLPACQVRLWAYCLMPNHVHLLAETGNQPLSAFMHRLQQSYTQRPMGSGLDISTILRRGAEGGHDSGRFVLDLLR